MPVSLLCSSSLAFVMLVCALLGAVGLLFAGRSLSVSPPGSSGSVAELLFAPACAFLSAMGALFARESSLPSLPGGSGTLLL